MQKGRSSFNTHLSGVCQVSAVHPDYLIPLHIIITLSDTLLSDDYLIPLHSNVLIMCAARKMFTRKNVKDVH